MFGILKAKKTGSQSIWEDSGGRFKGSFDNLIGTTLSGWAADRESNEAVYVVVVCEQKILGVARANQLREDVAKSGEGPKLCGFAYNIVNTFEGPYEQIFILAVGKEIGESIFQLCNSRDRLIDGPIITINDIAGLQEKGSAQILLPSPSALASLNSRSFSQVDKSRLDNNINQGMCLIEIQDLMDFLRDNAHVTGIQRTVCGFINTLMDGSEKFDDFAFCVVADTPDHVLVFDKLIIHHLVTKVLTGTAVQSHLKRRIEAAYDTAEMYKPSPNDNLIISGAYWIVSNFGAKLFQLKRSGILIGAYIYDIIPITSPQWVHESTSRSVIDKGFDVFVLADYFLTISEFVKKDLTQLLNSELGSAKPTTAVPLPHELPFRHDVANKTVSSVAQAVQSPPRSDYVLCVCTIEGRKNHILLARVWASLIRRHGFESVPRLVVVGKWGWRFEEFREFCEATNYLNGKISIHLGVDDAKLSHLYANCLFTVFPSFAEGWGLPVGESLTQGKFCVASNATSIPEVGGSFVDYFNPHDLFNAVDVIENAIFTPGYLEARTKNIVDHFKPRTWNEATENFMHSIRAHVEQARLRRTTPDLAQPMIEPGHVYMFLDIASSQTISWTEKKVRFCLSSGWCPIESWGAWSKMPNADVSFLTRVREGEKLNVLIRLNLPNAYQGEAIAVRSDDKQIADLSGGVLGSTPTWVQIELVAGSNGLISFSLCRPAAFAKVEHDRQIHLGISGLAYYEQADWSAALKTMKHIAKLVDVVID